MDTMKVITEETICDFCMNYEKLLVELKVKGYAEQDDINYYCINCIRDMVKIVEKYSNEKLDEALATLEKIEKQHGKIE